MARRADAGRGPPPLEALHAIVLTMSGDWTAGESSAQRAIVRFGDGWWSDPAGRFVWNVAARGVALSERWADDDPSVRDATMAMRRDPRRGISLEGVRALGHAFAGRPVDALRIAAGIRHAAPTMSILRIELALAEALARLEIGDRRGPWPSCGRSPITRRSRGCTRPSPRCWRSPTPLSTTAASVPP